MSRVVRAFLCFLLQSMFLISINITESGLVAKPLDSKKVCKDLIDKDLKMGYIPIWNDETAWNKYLFENPPSIMLNQSYIYPDFPLHIFPLIYFY